MVLLHLHVYGSSILGLLIQPLGSPELHIKDKPPAMRAVLINILACVPRLIESERRGCDVAL